MTKISKNKSQKKIVIPSSSIPKPIDWVTLFLGGIILGILTLYWATLSFDFTNLDDSIFVKKNVTNFLSFNELLRTFHEGCFYIKDAYYRPVLMIYFKLMNYNFSDSLLVSYHLANILFHCLNIVLVFVFLKLINSNRLTNLLLTAIFALHPCFTMAIAWIPGINDLLLTTFALLYFIFLLQYFTKAKPVLLFISSIFLLLAIFTKETGIFLPIIGLALIVHQFGFKTLFSKKILWLVLIYSLQIGAWYFLRKDVLDTASSNIITKNWFLVLPYRLLSILQYSSKAILPINLCVYPELNKEKIWIDILVNVLFVVSFSGYLIYNKLKNNTPFIFLGIGWFGLFLTPILFMPSASVVVLFEHRLYLPFIGILITIIPIINSILEADKKIIFASCFLLIGMYIFQIINYLPSFSNSFEFCKNAAIRSPYSARAQLNYGKILAKKNEMINAEKYIQLALQLDSGLHNARYYLALYNYIPNQKLDSALILLHQELHYSPEFPNNYLEISRCYLNKKEYIKSEYYLEKYAELLPADTRIVTIMLQLYIQNNHFEKAKIYSDKMIKKSVAVDSVFIKAIDQYLVNKNNK